jgi:hypothetical protein
MRFFTLHRMDDETGVSGTGVVAWGVEWPDGSVTLRWVGATPSTVHYEGGIEHVKKVHGHNGKTVIHWKDKDSNDAQFTE